MTDSYMGDEIENSRDTEGIGLRRKEVGFSLKINLREEIESKVRVEVGRAETRCLV